jgi:VIT1/CCC1 family predicted Fe2+/Mn2+ transporter
MIAMAGTLSDERRIDDPAWLRAHLEEERRRADLLAEIREAIFGAQDGIVSILTVVSTLGAATSDNHVVLIGGIATTVAEVFSMAAGEYMGSKSQHEVFMAQIEDEREEVRDRPEEAQAEVAFMLERDGLDPERAKRAAAEIASNPEVLLRTMVEKELGLAAESDIRPARGAFILSGALAVAALIPLLPYVFFPARTALIVSVIASAVALFGLGLVKARWTRGNPLRSGLEIVALAAVAGIGGYLVGTVLPEFVAGIHP